MAPIFLSFRFTSQMKQWCNSTADIQDKEREKKSVKSMKLNKSIYITK